MIHDLLIAKQHLLPSTHFGRRNQESLFTLRKPFFIQAKSCKKRFAQRAGIKKIDPISDQLFSGPAWEQRQWRPKLPGDRRCGLCRRDLRQPGVHHLLEDCARGPTRNPAHPGRQPLDILLFQRFPHLNQAIGGHALCDGSAVYRANGGTHDDLRLPGACVIRIHVHFMILHQILVHPCMERATPAAAGEDECPNCFRAHAGLLFWISIVIEWISMNVNNP